MSPDLKPLRAKTNLRLESYDYSQAGAYFVTVCAWRRQSLFVSPDVKAIVEAVWRDVPDHFPAVIRDVFVVMPNHFHAVIMLNSVAVGSQHAGSLRPGRNRLEPGSLSVIVRSFKAATTRQLRAGGFISGEVWQRNFYDHVIRNQPELDRIREYVALNPARWQFDYDNPDRVTDSQYERAWSWLEARS